MKIIMGLTGQVVGGGFICNGQNGVKGHVFGGGGGGTTITKIIMGLISNICKFLSRLVTEMKLRILTGMAE